MHIVESYATSCGVKVGKPSIYARYFPMAVTDYVTIDCDARSQAKLYHYWQEVVDILVPALKESGLTLVQVGRKDDPPMKGCYDTRGQASLNQMAYILSNSKLHIGVDNFTADLAGFYNVKNVCVFSNSIPENSRPYWDNENSVHIQSPKDGKKPSYSHSEFPKTINLIEPDKIANKACELINLNSNFDFNYEYLGIDYHTPRANLIPDSMIANYGLPPMTVSVRMDYLFNEEGLAANLQTARVNIVTDKPINPNIISQLKQGIGSITYIIDEQNDPNFIKFLLSNGISYNLISYLPEEKINNLKLNYMDYGIITPQEKLTKDNVFNKGIDKPLFYKSNKFILSSGKIYPSKPAWKRELPTNTLDKPIMPVIDDEDFWDDVNSYCIFSAK